MRDDPCIKVAAEVADGPSIWSADSDVSWTGTLPALARQPSLRNPKIPRGVARMQKAAVPD
jgi:hypothetical protein